MAIKEETYTSHCPVHGQLMITKRTKKIKTRNGEVYTKHFENITNVYIKDNQIIPIRLWRGE